MVPLVPLIRGAPQGEDVIGEAAVARQAVRMMLDARRDGGWVAGKVEINTWDIRDVAEAQAMNLNEGCGTKISNSRH